MNSEERNYSRYLQNAETQFTASYRNNQIIASQSPESQFLLSLKTELGIEASVGALVAILPNIQITILTTRAGKIGYWRALASMAGADEQAATATKRSFEQHITEGSSLIQKLKSDRDDATSKYDELTTKLNVAVAQSIISYDVKAEGADQSREERANAKFAEIDATLARFQNQLKLKGPVKYWQDKRLSIIEKFLSAGSG